MSSLPLVSVVIPSYGRPDLVEQAIESVLNQTYKNIELIIVDDHSPIPVKETLSERILDDTRTNVIRLSKNRGANAARNIGIRKSAGKYVSFLDDDDVWLKEKVQRQVIAFDEADSNVGVVFTGLRHIQDDGTPLGKATPEFDNIGTEDLLQSGEPILFSTIMVRSEVIDRAGLLDERFPSWQDREWCIRLSENCTFKSIPEPLVRKLTSDYEQIGDDFEAKRDVSYPLLLQKHSETARKYGKLTERRFISEQSYQLGRAAMRNRYYSDARKYLLRSIYTYPFRVDSFVHLTASIGGKTTHDLCRFIGRKMNVL